MLESSKDEEKEEEKIKILRILTSWLWNSRKRRKRVWVDAKITEIRVPFDPRPLKYSSGSEKDKAGQVLLFADDWNEKISEAIRCFVFVTVGIFHPCVSYGSDVDLWWIMMYCRDFISWTLAFGIIRISIVLIQYILIWKLLFRLGKLNMNFKEKSFCGFCG